MIIFDKIQPAAREVLGERPQLLRRHPLRLQRRSGQRPRLHAQAASQIGDIVQRSTKRLDQAIRDDHVLQDYIFVQRCIAEDHIQELAGIVPDGLGGETDTHREHAIAYVVDIFHDTHDIGQDRHVLYGGQRHLDTLLDGDGPRARLDVLRGATDMVGDSEACLLHVGQTTNLSVISRATLAKR